MKTAFMQEIEVLHPEGLVIRQQDLKVVCSECRQELKPQGFNSVGVFTWACGCRCLVQPRMPVQGGGQ